MDENTVRKGTNVNAMLQQQQQRCKQELLPYPMVPTQSAEETLFKEATLLRVGNYGGARDSRLLGLDQW